MRTPTPAERATFVPWSEVSYEPPYDIEADWVLMSTCAYRCAYCFWDVDALGAKISTPATVDRLASFFEGTGLVWLLHLTGGEPFMYPGFLRLCQSLTRRHYISINTNADSPRIRAFTETVDPEHVDFVHCGVHEEQRALKSGRGRFIENVMLFKNAGFPVFASVVMDPRLFPTFGEMWQEYADRGVTLIPKALRGPYEGRTYPRDYTDDQRRLFLAYARRAADHYATQFAARKEPPSVNPFMDGPLFLHDRPDYRGVMCGAGHRFVRIMPDAAIYRCGPADLIGNVAEGWFERREDPSVCVDKECPYFCEKYKIT
ncbi:radical SAM protein [Nonomuraea turkmeniaca]|uniref:Radical SAM protein n=1 Tax=Nonomuraea turkmeniaca TaxID=103838 RepID=A0A5S4FNE8_9ACTN|nr:radical SAM protein [Nonomuraea turkmeniaca]TMR21974.1 radical SAM protein [Nonomuraea turkmeniaca]